MKSKFLEFSKAISFILLVTFGLFYSSLAQTTSTPQKAILLEINGPIGPATQDYFHRGLEHAISKHAEFVILQIDTPGGLDSSMREIIKDILASPIPIVAYVAPDGARAASAGTYILYASHIAAMAHATNLGAATPVFMESPLTKLSDKESSKEKTHQNPHENKVVNDATAYIKGLAKLRERNSDWAEKAVKEAASLHSQEALKLGVINIVAKDIPDLLKQLDGKVIPIQSQSKTIKTQDLTVEAWSPDWRVRFLKIITDPNIAYILLLIGIYGFFFEFSNPGFVLPGVMGAISLLLALYGFQLLPLNYAGLALLLAGVFFIITELYMTSYGILGIGGLISFVVGSILLFDLNGYSVPWGLIAGTSLFTVSFFLIIIRLILKVRSRQVVSGPEALIGCVLIIQEDIDKVGRVKIGGESWKARSPIPLKGGQAVKIIKVTGLELGIEPINSEEHNNVRSK